MPAQTFSVHNILGKSPNDPRLEDVYDIDKAGKPLGKGAFGVVRLGVRKSDGKQFAVKSIAKTKLVCKEDVQDVRSEVAIMNLVAGHTNVVTLMVSSGHMLGPALQHPTHVVARVLGHQQVQAHESSAPFHAPALMLCR